MNSQGSSPFMFAALISSVSSWTRLLLFAYSKWLPLLKVTLHSYDIRLLPNRKSVERTNSKSCIRLDLYSKVWTPKGFHANCSVLEREEKARMWTKLIKDKHLEVWVSTVVIKNTQGSELRLGLWYQPMRISCGWAVEYKPYASILKEEGRAGTWEGGGVEEE